MSGENTECLTLLFHIHAPAGMDGIVTDSAFNSLRGIGEQMAMFAKCELGQDVEFDKVEF